MDAGRKGHPGYSKSSTQSGRTRGQLQSLHTTGEKEEDITGQTQRNTNDLKIFHGQKEIQFWILQPRKEVQKPNGPRAAHQPTQLNQTPTHTSPGINAQDHQNTCTANHQNVRTGQKIKPVSSPTLFTKPRSTRTLETKPMVRTKEESW